MIPPLPRGARENAQAETEKKFVHAAPLPGAVAVLVLRLTYVGHGFTRKAAVHGAGPRFMTAYGVPDISRPTARDAGTRSSDRRGTGISALIVARRMQVRDSASDPHPRTGVTFERARSEPHVSVSTPGQETPLFTFTSLHGLPGPIRLGRMVGKQVADFNTKNWGQGPGARDEERRTDNEERRRATEAPRAQRVLEWNEEISYHDDTTGTTKIGAGKRRARCVVVVDKKYARRSMLTASVSMAPWPRRGTKNRQRTTRNKQRSVLYRLWRIWRATWEV